MATTSGDVIHQEILSRACGCQVPFLHYAVDPFRDGRRVKFLAKRCHPCGRLASDEHVRQQKAGLIAPPGPPKKGREVKQLKPGTRLLLVRQEDGTWQGGCRLTIAGSL